MMTAYEANPIAPVIFLCERGDRWYRAVCRFADVRPTTRSRITIRRFPTDKPMALVHAATALSSNLVAIWELPDLVAHCLPLLDAIATLRSQRPDAIQFAHIPDHLMPSLSLPILELGVTMPLRDPSELQKHLRNCPEITSLFHPARAAGGSEVSPGRATETNPQTIRPSPR